MYVENFRKGMKNHGFSKNGMFLLCLDCIMYEKRSILYNKVVLPSYQLYTIFYKYLLRFLPLKYSCICKHKFFQLQKIKQLKRNMFCK